jgi:hypothetical protein
MQAPAEYPGELAFEPARNLFTRREQDSTPIQQEPPCDFRHSAWFFGIHHGILKTQQR